MIAKKYNKIYPKQILILYLRYERVFSKPMLKIVEFRFRTAFGVGNSGTYMSTT